MMPSFRFLSGIPIVLLQLTIAPALLLPVYGAAHGTSGEGGPRVRGYCPSCPYFINTTTHVTAPQGLPANLTCGVRNLMDRKVSWIRRKDLHVLTTGAFTYTTDVRFRAVHVEGSPYWTLEVGSPTTNDSGVYECQVSTQPKIFRRFNLNVIVPSAEIRGGQQLFMKAGSDINITCVVEGAVRGAPVTWYHVLPKPRNGVSVIEINIGVRGGVQLVTDKNQGTSWLLVTYATWKDAGNYTCAPAYAKPASISVHVLDEETPAAMQHDLQPSSGSCRNAPPPFTLLLLLGAVLSVVTVTLSARDGFLLLLVVCNVLIVKLSARDSLLLLLPMAILSILIVTLSVRDGSSRSYLSTWDVLIKSLIITIYSVLMWWIFLLVISTWWPRRGLLKPFQTPFANVDNIFGLYPPQLL